MDLEIVILSEVSQTQKDKHHMPSFMCGIYCFFFKRVQIAYLQNKSRAKQTLLWREGKRDKLGVWD